MMLYMPSKNPPTPLRAPSGGARGSSSTPDVPGVDDRLVTPETREEMVHGRPILAVPANAPHGDAHCHLDGEAGFHVRPGYVASTDLLTRASRGSDFATDTSIRRQGVDPATDARYLEEMVFEVVHEQSLRDITDRAKLLAARGIRRIFAIFVKRGEVSEWSSEAGAWQPLGPEDAIEDECLLRPLPVRALLDRQEGRNAVARVLLDERNPVLEEARQGAWRSGRADGLVEGRREAVTRLCQLLSIDLTSARLGAMDRMSATDLGALSDWLARERRWP
jgi:hypothetical protein